MLQTRRNCPTHFAATVQNGFSLIEIMIALLIIGLMAGIGIPAALTYLENSRKKTAKIELKGFQDGIKMFYASIGKYPEKLRDLVKAPENAELARKWEGPYVEGVGEKRDQVKEDPWGNKYQYKYEAGKTAAGQVPYELYSYGSNGKGAPKNEWIYPS